MAEIDIETTPVPAALVALDNPSAPGKLHRQLSPLGVLLLTFSCLSPALSIFGIGADVVQHTGAGAATLFLIGLAAAAIWGLVYAELGSAFPYSGADYVGVGRILGPWAGLATLVIWAMTYPPSIAFSVRTFAVYMGGLLPGVPEPVVIYGGLTACVAVALLSVRSGAWITGLFFVLEMAAVAALLVVGFSHPNTHFLAAAAHPLAPGPTGLLAPVSLGALALGGVNTVYGTVGGNQAIAFGEEMADPHRRMGGVVVVAAVGGGLCIALPVVAVLLGANDIGALAHSASPFALFMSTRLGPWAAVALNVGVAISVFNATIATIMVTARLYFSMGRENLWPAAASRQLVKVNPKSGTPWAATLVVALVAALCCPLPSHTLLVIMSGLLVYAWGPVCFAVLVGRGKGLTGAPGYWRAPLFPLAPVLGLLMTLVFVVADILDPEAGRPSLIVLGIAFGAAILWNRFVLQKRAGGWTPSIAD